MMDAEYECPKDQDGVTTAEIQWFYSKSKVPICLAISDSFHFLNKLKEASILSEEEALELQGDTRTVHRVVYECLCLIEDKDNSSQNFFKFFKILFQKSLLKKYPDLVPIYREYKEGKYRNGAHSTADQDNDPLIFAKEKVKICLTITNRFPFLHGLQDLTILSESESLKLQADERPASRVIYESLSLIEKKDLKLYVVFEYIFQQCYLKLYPGLQDILREPTDEYVSLFNGGQYPIFNSTTDLLEFFDHNKKYICEAVNERFPFLNGLHDFRLLSHIQLLKLQADRRSTKEVIYETLCYIQTTSDIENFFAYVFQKFYLEMYPDLHITLNSLNAALRLDICLPSPVSCTEKMTETQDQYPNTLMTVGYEGETRDAEKQDSREPSQVVYEDGVQIKQEQEYNEFPVEVPKEEITQLPKQNCSEPSPVSYENETQERESSESFTGSEDILQQPVRTCRLQPISYSEPPDFICEINCAQEKQRAPENTKSYKYGRRKSQGTRRSSFYLKGIFGLAPGTKHVIVKVEFPKQVFNDHFQVRCGHKTGTFNKAHWTGNSSKDLCIDCEGRKFSVITFEKYGGRASCKNWKKTIHCEKIKLESLIEAGILKRPKWFNKYTDGAPKAFKVDGISMRPQTDQVPLDLPKLQGLGPISPPTL